MIGIGKCLCDVTDWISGCVGVEDLDSSWRRGAVQLCSLERTGTVVGGFEGTATVGVEGRDGEGSVAG